MAGDAEIKPKMRLEGRTVAYYDAERIDAGNVMDMLAWCSPVFARTSSECMYLWNYYRGEHPVEDRVKEVRPDIRNVVVENRAQEIVAFKVGYQLQEPVMYGLRTRGDAPVGEGEDGYGRKLADLDEFNAIVADADKEACDRDLYEYMCVCGQAYRAVDKGPEGAPLSVRALPPWNTFYVRRADWAADPLACVWLGLDLQNGRLVRNVWTPERLITVVDEQVVSDQPHPFGAIPVVEYKLNTARMGVFEPALPLLDAIDAIESNRLDDVEQTVQSLMKFVNCDVDEETFEAMLRLGAVKVRSYENLHADVDFIKNALDQNGVQVTKEDLVSSVTSICGMPTPSRKGASTSDTGAAVMLRDGWSLAESHAKGYEIEFKRSERDFLRLALRACRLAAGVSVDLKPRDVTISCNRRNYENIQVKAQVLTTMLASEWIHPQLAFKACGMFSDPEAAYLQSLRWHDEHDGGGEPAADVPGTEPGAPAPAVPQPTEGETGANAPSA